MKSIPLTQGMMTIVDDEDYEELSKYKWYFALGYAVRGGPVINGKRQPLIRMHRQILKVPTGMEVDHISRDTLDNRRCNLRSVTHTQNQWNRGVSRNNTTGHNGVCFHKGKQRFMARIQKNRRVIYLGYYGTAEEAHVAYHNAASRLYEGIYR